MDSIGKLERMVDCHGLPWPELLSPLGIDEYTRKQWVTVSDMAHTLFGKSVLELRATVHVLQLAEDEEKPLSKVRCVTKLLGFYHDKILLPLCDDGNKLFGVGDLQALEVQLVNSSWGGWMCRAHWAHLLLRS